MDGHSSLAGVAKKVGEVVFDQIPLHSPPVVPCFLSSFISAISSHSIDHRNGHPGTEYN